MEDGKDRHLFQLQPKKQEILRLLPDLSLREHLQYMKRSIQGRSFPLNLFGCCLSYKHSFLSLDFSTSFESLSTPHKIVYYRTFILAAIAIAKKRSKFSQTTYILEQPKNTTEQMPIRYRIEGSQWKNITITVNSTTKIIESEKFRFDLHKTYLSCPHGQKQNDSVLLIPWKENLLEVEVTELNEQNTNLCQRLQCLANSAIQENIVNLIEHQDAERQQSDNLNQELQSHRSLRQGPAMLEQDVFSAKHSIREVQPSNHLTYPHPVAAYLASDNPVRLRHTGSLHYFLQGQWIINEDGELVSINKKKLQAQGLVIKYIIKRLFTGTKIFSISLPVSVFHTESNLSLLLNSYRHAPLELESAAQQQSPLDRLLKVVRFALTCPPCYIRVDKPFNPILGQTYQAIVNGTLFYGEQICHHPPISAVFIKGRQYTAHGQFEADIKFGLNSATGNNKGWLSISFDPHDHTKQIVRFNNTPGEMSGLIFGDRTLNLQGCIEFIDEDHLLYCKLAFGTVTLPNTKEYKDSVEGRIIKLAKGFHLNKSEEFTEIPKKMIEKELGIITGRWLSKVYFNQQVLIDTLEEDPLEVERYPALLPSDYSLREDVILKKKGDQEECQTAKQNLEEIQRADRKLREKYAK